jgi:hypothetical protein
MPNFSYADTGKIIAKFVQISEKQNFFSINLGSNDGLKIDNVADFYIDDEFKFKAIVRKSASGRSAWKIIEQNKKVQLTLNDNLTFLLVESELDGLTLTGDSGGNHTRIPMFSKELDYSNVKNLFSK